MAKARIPVPNVSDPVGVLTLLLAVDKGIKNKGKDALITGELAAEIAAAAAKVPTAQAAQARAEDLLKEVEKLYQQRNAVVAECLPLNQRGSKALQGNLGAARLREMGDYGYTVNDGAQTPKPPKK